MAVVTLMISACGKKNNAEKAAKASNSGAGLDCEKKDKDSQQCKDALAKKLAAEKSRELPAETASLPVTANEILAIELKDKSSLVGNIKLAKDKEDIVATRINCQDLNNQDKIVNELNSEKLEAKAKIFLFNKSMVLTSLNVKGASAVEEKKYLVICNNDSKVEAAQYKSEPSTQVKELKQNEVISDLIATDDKLEDGVLTTIKCLSDNDLLIDKDNASDVNPVNRIRLKSGSAIAITRAINKKIDDKTLKELDNDFKDKKTVVVSCK